MPNYSIKNPDSIKQHLRRRPLTLRDVGQVNRRALAVAALLKQWKGNPGQLDPRAYVRAMDDTFEAVSLLEHGVKFLETVPELVRRLEAGDVINLQVSPGIGKEAENAAVERVRTLYTAARYHERQRRDLEILRLVMIRSRPHLARLGHEIPQERKLHGNSPSAIAAWVNKQIRFTMPGQKVSEHQVKRMLSKLSHAEHGLLMGANQ